jgi:hypothetical protein
VAKRKFKIICYKDGENEMFDTRIKTWFGWVSFSVFYKSYILHVFSEPLPDKEKAYERIYQYCNVKGHKKENIVIIETMEI